MCLFASRKLRGAVVVLLSRAGFANFVSKKQLYLYLLRIQESLTAGSKPSICSTDRASTSTRKEKFHVYVRFPRRRNDWNLEENEKEKKGENESESGGMKANNSNSS